MNIIEACHDDNLFKPFFQDISTWRKWFVLLRAFYGLPPAPGDIEIYQKHTGRDKWPTRPAKELWVIVGRRSGKSFTSALTATYEAAFRQHSLAIGEVGYVLIVSPTRQQALIEKKYISGFFDSNPMLRAMVIKDREYQIELNNKITIQVLSSDFRSLRGFTAVACIADELGFFYSEGSRPDFETLRALRPTLTTTGGPLICIGSPYSKAGALFNSYKNYYGRDGDVLVWQAASRDMNPTLDEGMILKAAEDDPEGAKAEWEGMFRDDIASFCTREAGEACVIDGRYELPPISGIAYFAFIDPSGGSRDSMTMAIAHAENEKIIIDCIRERVPPFSPESVVQEFCETLKSYHVSFVRGDRFGGEWCREPFRKHGINYELSEKAKSDIYQSFLPLINSGQVELLDNKKMINQLLNLERKTSRSGRDSIDHAPGAHDDCINSCAGVALLAKENAACDYKIHFIGGDEPSPWIEIPSFSSF